jgi:hypothetical protein
VDAVLGAGNTWSAEVNTQLFDDGEVEVVLTITDNAGKVSTRKVLYYFDNTAPIVLVKNPLGYADNFYNGVITIRGEAADRFGISRVDIQIIPDGDTVPGGAELADGTNSWAFEFDTREYSDLDTSGDIVVGLVATAEDRAGNVSETVLHYDDVLARNSGAPITVEDIMRIASGMTIEPHDLTATDIFDPADPENDISFSSIPIQIDNDLDKPTVSFVAPNNGQNIGGSVLVTGTAFDDDGVKNVRMRLDLNGDGDFDDSFDLSNPPDGDTLDDFETESLYVEISGLNETVWTQQLNLDGELYQVELGHEGQVRIEVIATDINDLEGNSQVIQVRFDDTIPRVESLSHVTGDYVSGQFTLTGDISDDERVDRVRISYDGGISYTDIFNRDDMIDTGISESPPYPLTTLSLSMAIDTGAIPGIGAVNSDPLYLRLLVIDNADYQALTYITLNVDNTIPEGAWDPAIDPMNINGGSATVQGTATDAGTVSGIAGTDVYFVRGTDIFNFDTGLFEAGATFDFGDGDVPDPIYTPDGSDDPDFLIRIDNFDEDGDDGGADGDGDGFNEDISLDFGVYTWSAQFNSNVIPDGAVEIHYVINDSAGNRNHYMEPGFIKNNVPSFTFRVGTDLDFNTTADGDENFDYDVAFDGHTEVRVLITPTDSGPNAGIASYAVRRVAPAATEISGGVLTSDVETDLGTFGILGGDGYAEYVSPGDEYELEIEVVDNDGISATESFFIRVDNVDDDDPTISLDPITLSSVYDGHVESAGESTHNNGTPDADVSGIVWVEGDAEDAQLIDEIWLQIAGFNGGAWFRIAYWDGASLVRDATAPEPSIDTPPEIAISETLSSADGHEASFAFPWDTSAITNVAANNVQITARVVDQATNTVDLATPTSVDVVPYISDLEIGLENGTLSYLQRSALGSYPVAFSNSGADTFRINGYNLEPGSVTIGANVLTVEGDDGNGTPLDGDYRWIDVRKNSANSGELVVTTNGIDSINNSNDNGLSQNQEASAFYPDRTDDRYVAMWGLESQTTWSGKTEAVMRPNAARDDMDWYYVNNGQDVYFNNTRLTYSWSILGGDITRNDNGTLMWVYLHNMNWFSGATAWDYWGSVQWGKDETYEAQAYNWHRANTDRLAIGNLSFDTDTNYPYTEVVLGRYQNLQILTDGGNGDTDNFVAYFDSAAESQSIVFWSFKTGTTVGGGTTMAGGWTSNLEKFTNGNTGANYPAGTYDVGLRTPFTGISRVEITSGGADSRHFDMAWDDANSRLYLAYYDAANSELRFAYNTDPVGTPGTWTTRPTAIDTGAGQHVDMTVDPSGGIHLAYFDGAGSNLKYAYLPAYDTLDGNIEVYTVDALFTNGMYNSIGLRDFDPGAGTDYRPVISSFSLSYAGTRFPVRVSWPTASIGSIADGASVGTGAYTGAWEVMAVPAATGSADADSFIETDGATAYQGQIVVGYNGSYIEEATLYDE